MASDQRARYQLVLPDLKKHQGHMTSLTKTLTYLFGVTTIHYNLPFLGCVVVLGALFFRHHWCRVARRRRTCRGDHDEDWYKDRTRDELDDEAVTLCRHADKAVAGSDKKVGMPSMWHTLFV